MEAIGYLPQDVSEMGWKCEHFALVQVQVGEQPSLWFLEVWLGTWFALSSYHPLHVLQGQACRPQRVLLLFLVRLGSQKEAKGIISYPTSFSHCCLSIGVMLMPIILYPAAWGWCVPIRWVIQEMGLSVLHAQMGMSLTVSTIQRRKVISPKLYLFFFFTF